MSERNKGFTIEEALASIGSIIGAKIKCDRVLISLCVGNKVLHGEWGESLEFSAERLTLFSWETGTIFFRNSPIAVPIFSQDTSRDTLPEKLATALQEVETKSFCLYPVTLAGRTQGWIECHFRGRYHKWTSVDNEILEYHVTNLLTTLSSFRDVSEPVKKESSSNIIDSLSHIKDFGTLIIVRSNNKMIVTEVIGDTEKLLGVTPDTLRKQPGVWSKFLPPPDFRVLLRSLKSSRARRLHFSDEVEVAHAVTGERKRILMYGLPFFDDKDRFSGWEGYAVDISDRYQIEAELRQQKKRLEVLFDLSNKLSARTEPSKVALEVVRALVDATGADAGFFLTGYLLQTEITAAHGLSIEALDEIEKVLPQNTVIRFVRESMKSTSLEDSFTLPPHNRFSHYRSVILQPVDEGPRQTGVLVLLKKSVGGFLASDTQLLSLGADRFSSALQQAISYASEKEQTDALSFLFKISRATAQLRDPKPIADRALTMIGEQIPSKRLWLGLINEPKTHIMGVSGVGAGMRKELQELQIELALPHEGLDETLRDQRARVVDPKEKRECSGLTRVIEVLKPDKFVIVPIVALGNTIGIVAIEPVLQHDTYLTRLIPLLTRVCQELGAVLHARLLEKRVTDADKMKMAGHFAGAVGHFFNNMLQVVIGQASLISVQVPRGTMADSAAQMIVDVANKGAELTKQLSYLTTFQTNEKESITYAGLYESTKKLLSKILDSDVTVEINDEKLSPRIYGSLTSIEKMISNILKNAKEALVGTPQAKVTILSKIVDLKTNEIHPDLAPGEYLRIDIADNGVGMRSDEITKCFEPFFTTKQSDPRTGVSYRASGLGLSVSYEIARWHKGIITASSKVGEGSTFSIYLPVYGSRDGTARRFTEVQKIDLQTIPDKVSQVRVPVCLVGKGDMIKDAKDALSLKGIPSASTDRERAVLLFARANADQASCIVLDYDVVGSARSIAIIRETKAINAKASFILWCKEGKDVEKASELQEAEIIEKPLGSWALVQAVARHARLAIGSVVKSVEVH